jgi:hypothetical protein
LRLETKGTVITRAFCASQVNELPFVVVVDEPVFIFKVFIVISCQSCAFSLLFLSSCAKTEDHGLFPLFIAHFSLFSQELFTFDDPVAAFCSLFSKRKRHLFYS